MNIFTASCVFFIRFLWLTHQYGLQKSSVGMAKQRLFHSLSIYNS